MQNRTETRFECLPLTLTDETRYTAVKLQLVSWNTDQKWQYNIVVNFIGVALTDGKFHIVQETEFLNHVITFVIQVLTLLCACCML